MNVLPDVKHGTTQKRLAFDVNVRPHLDPGFFLFNLGRSMQSQTAVVIKGFFSVLIDGGVGEMTV